VDHHRVPIALGVNRDVAFAPAHLFLPVVAEVAIRLGGFGRLAVVTLGRRIAISAISLPHLSAQRSIDLESRPSACRTCQRNAALMVISVPSAVH